ncbi:MAG: sugar phosphate isomerase/epimerase family protein [Bryobacteraceae bacterium]
MTRRDFQFSLAAAAAPRTFEFRYLVATCLYGGMSLDEIVPEVPRTGARAIDVWSSHAEPVPQRTMIDTMGRARFRALLDRHRTRLACLTHFRLGPFGLKDEIPIAAELGGKNTLLVTGTRWPGKPVPVTDAASHKAAIRQFVSELRPHVEWAEKHGVVIALENHGGQILSTPDSVRWLIEAERSPALGIALSPYHLDQDPAMLARLIEDLGNRMVLFYAWQHGKGSTGKMSKEDELQQLPGRGPLDFKPLVRALVKIRYTGWTEIFMHPFPRGIPILPTVSEVTGEINRARKYLGSFV